MRNIFLLIAVIFLFAASQDAEARLTVVPIRGMPHTPVLALYQEVINESYIGSSDRNMPVSLVSCDRETIACLMRGKNDWYMKFPDLGHLHDSSYDPIEWTIVRLLFLHESAHFDDVGVARQAGQCRALRITSCDGGNLSYRFQFAKLHGVSARKLNQNATGANWYWRGKIPLAEKWADTVSFCSLYPDGIPQDVIARYKGYEYPFEKQEHLQACTIVNQAATDNGWD